jgi:large-conductance mechanosensitive channel
MTSPSYGIDVVALAFAVILAAALAFLLSHLVQQLVELMTTPSPPG